jgi:hypothetical protein
MSSRTTVVGLLLVALVVGIAPPGLVLCVSEGDHIAIELHPCSAPTEADSDVCGATPADDCTDTPLLTAALRASSDPASVALPASVLTLCAPRATAGIAARALDRGIAPHGGLRALRTIVLIV